MPNQQGRVRLDSLNSAMLLPCSRNFVSRASGHIRQIGGRTRTVSDTITHLREDLDRGRGSVELASTVVGDPDAVDTLPYRLRRVLRGHDALHHDLQYA